jgi:hypothetical protein
LFLWFSLIAATVLVPFQAFSQNIPSSAQIRTVIEHSSYEIKEDGTFVEEVVKAIEPIGPSDAQQIGQMVFPFQAGVVEIDILDAYTLKPDGRKIQVSHDKIITQGLPSVADSPTFSDMQAKVLFFPDVAVGDQVVYRLRKRVLKARIPGRFDVFHYFPDSSEHEDVRVRFKYPKSFPLRYEAVGLQEAETKEEGDFLVREWTCSNNKAVPGEKGEVDPMDRAPRIVASSFTGWEDVAQSIQALMDENPAPPKDIHTLANEITKGCVSERESAEAIYQWVSSRIRYVLLVLGANGYKPADSSSILKDRYGDCKGKVKVLCELLEAKGIECSPALVSAGSSFLLPGIPTLQTFNHMICYLPGLDVYLDPSAGIIPFGGLGEAEADKPVIHTRNFRKIKHTPRVIADKAVLWVKTEIFADEDGSARGQTTVKGWNEMAIALRVGISMIGNVEERRRAFVIQYLNWQHLVGDGKLLFDEPQGQAPEYGYRVDFSLKQYPVSEAKGGSFRLLSGLFSVYSIWQLLSPLNPPEEKANHVAMNLTIFEEMAIHVPDSIRIDRMPKGVRFSNANGSYRSTCWKEDRTLRLVRRIVQKYPHSYRTPAEGAAFGEVSNAARPDFSAEAHFRREAANTSTP